MLANKALTQRVDTLCNNTMVLKVVSYSERLSLSLVLCLLVILERAVVIQGVSPVTLYSIHYYYDYGARVAGRRAAHGGTCGAGQAAGEPSQNEQTRIGPCTI